MFQLPSTGELVYNMAGVVVIYDINTNKQRHYTEHNDDVKWLDFHILFFNPFLVSPIFF